MAIEMASMVQHGSKAIWMTEGAYVHNKMIEYDFPEQQAEMMWFKELETLPANRIS